ncbi:7-deoxyloganetin glucosyltransferase-like [Solanum stenotomum]|uniref:7-deoxyloganetin glucosyltransferase-like n=1 Tax=Solanum stenotomum TaxID=172797 RepID=UPI0020D027DE|nr:7-deoxyloganetin glucosyltransferase-like [Solanum stenotomum]
MKSSGQNQKPHAVCIPFPAQGHINPMLNLAKLLHYKGFHITFVHTEFNYKRILLESSDHESLNSSSSFRFETIPDGLISSDALASTTQDLTELCVSTQKNLSAPFRSLLDRIDQSTDDENIPAVSCIVSDGFMSFTIDAAEQLGIPHVLFYTLTAMTVLCFFQYYPQIIERRISPPKVDWSNLWRNDSDCIEWLDSRDPASVIYVNFGSTTVMTSRQFEEFGWGLANSMKNFLWIVRPDLVISDDVVPLPLPPEYLFHVQDRGKIVTWCDQVLVLEHPAIGGFLTHCGWNSIFESLSLGVPMLCWPFFGDQQTNRMCCCKKWGVGIEIEEDVKREEIERIVKEVMEGEKGKEIKRKAMEWKQEIQKAVNPNGGSSYLNLDKLIEEVLLC